MLIARAPVRISLAGGGTDLPAYYERHGARCRDFIHTVWIDGRRQQMRGTACRNPDGTWTQVS